MRSILAATALSALAAPSLAQGERITVTGEVVDTWCYFSGVMGGPDAVVGASHHTCALWCSAGGIPVGLLTPEGEMYMILKLPGQAGAAGGDTQLFVAAHEITADGLFFERDGLNYIIVEEVVADAGLTVDNALDNGAVPPFTVPKGDR